MRTLFALCAALACVLAAQAEQEAFEKTVFFKDVPVIRPKAEDGSVDRIFHGSVAGRTQFPYMASMFMDLSIFCGGSLINEEWVLTAAHCVKAGDVYYVFLGGSESMTPHQDNRKSFVTRASYFHPDYDRRRIINDIGVIHLMRKATLSDYIKLVALTPPDESYIGQTGTVSGYGVTDDGDTTQISPQLRYTTLSIVNNTVCTARYGSSSGHRSVICLRADTTSSCTGDSGSPLVLRNNKDSLIQIGVVSFGAAAGCTLGYPVGHTNVAMFVEWLENTTGLTLTS